jgi:Fe-Mn family superoxide dismutase
MIMAYELPKLPYAYDALEPHIDARTMEIHYTKHHQTYITNVNNAIKGKADLEKKSVEDLISDLSAVPKIFAQWCEIMAAGTPIIPSFGKSWARMLVASQKANLPMTSNPLLAVLARVDDFKAKFAAAGVGRFGSGWAWLIKNKGGKLEIISTPNQDSPLMDGNTPILGVDVWEHAYYLKYQNRRADYLKAWWNVGELGRGGENY